jgi:hypothetical protein
MAQGPGLTVARGASTWLVRVYLGREPRTMAPQNHNQTIHDRFAKRRAFSISASASG